MHLLCEARCTTQDAAEAQGRRLLRVGQPSRLRRGLRAVAPSACRDTGRRPRRISRTGSAQGGVQARGHRPAARQRSGEGAARRLPGSCLTLLLPPTTDEVVVAWGSVAALTLPLCLSLCALQLCDSRLEGHRAAHERAGSARQVCGAGACVGGWAGRVLLKGPSCSGFALAGCVSGAEVLTMLGRGGAGQQVPTKRGRPSCTGPGTSPQSRPRATAAANRSTTTREAAAGCTARSARTKTRR